MDVFGFIQCKYILILLVTFPNTRAFGMGMIIYSCITPAAQMQKTILSVAILRGWGWVGHGPPRSLVGPRLAPQIFRNFPFKFV